MSKPFHVVATLDETETGDQVRFADLLFFEKTIYCVYFDIVPLARVNQMHYNDLAIKNCILNEWMLLNLICDNNP